MTAPTPDALDVAVLGAGPAGVIAALRAARLGAKTALVTHGEFGGMAANDGPVPVRTLAQAARLIREAKQLSRYGITAGKASLDYGRLLDRVAEVTQEARKRSLLRDDLDRAGVAIYEHAGTARFVDSHTIESEGAPRLRAEKVIICTGGASRRLPIPGFELTATHSDAWQLASPPASLLVVGAGATGVQVASIFNAFGSKVCLLEVGPRILMTEDADVSEAVGRALTSSGINVIADAGRITGFERCPGGVRLVRVTGGVERSLEAAVVVIAVGWVAATAALSLERAGVETDQRGFVRVDSLLRTSAPHIFAAGDVTGHALIAHEAVREGLVAATNAVLDAGVRLPDHVSPMGSFTDPEYASVGLTEAGARERHEVLVATQPFHSVPRPIIDGRETGFCKLVVDREFHSILGCHIVGERAVELAQVAATAMAGDMTVHQLASVPFSFPTYANALGRAAVLAAIELDDGRGSALDQLVAADGVGV